MSRTRSPAAPATLGPASGRISDETEEPTGLMDLMNTGSSWSSFAELYNPSPTTTDANGSAEASQHQTLEIETGADAGAKGVREWLDADDDEGGVGKPNAAGTGTGGRGGEREVKRPATGRVRKVPSERLKQVSSVGQNMKIRAKKKLVQHGKVSE